MPRTVLVHRFSCPSPGGMTCSSTVTYGSLRCTCSQLLSEADLPENHGCLNLFLPNHWSRRVKSALLHVISMARLACVHTWGWAAGSLDTRIGQETDRGQAAIGLSARIRHWVIADYGLRHRCSPSRPLTRSPGPTGTPMAVGSRYFLGISSSIDSPAACPMRVYQMALPK